MTISNDFKIIKYGFIGILIVNLLLLIIFTAFSDVDRWKVLSILLIIINGTALIATGTAFNSIPNIALDSLDALGI
jgi:hypothetical protein